MSAGRRPKIGLDFAGWEVGVLDNDGKIDRLIEAQGIAAFTVYFYLCQHAYATHGYYLDWSYSQCATTARKLGKGASAEFVRNVVSMCFECCLFDKRLFQQYGILTSRGIQRRYWSAIQERISKYEPKQFWLLKPEECQGFDLCTQNSDFPSGNTATVQKSKEENMTVEKRVYTGSTCTLTPPTLEKIREYCEKNNIAIDAEYFFDYHTQNGWVMSNGIAVKDWRARVRAWAKREKKYREREEPSEYEELVESYVPVYKKKGSSNECGNEKK